MKILENAQFISQRIMIVISFLRLNVQTLIQVAIIFFSVGILWYITDEKQLAFLILAIMFLFYFFLAGTALGKKSNGTFIFSANSTKIGLFLPYLNRTLIMGSLLYGIFFKVTEGSQSYYIIVAILVLGLLLIIPLALNVLVIQRSGLSYVLRWSVDWSDVVDFEIDLLDKKLIINSEKNGSKMLYFRCRKDLEDIQTLVVVEESVLMDKAE